MSATPADPTIPAPATKCIKCQNETTTTADLSDAANFCTDCCLSLKTEQQQHDTTTKAITETEAEQPQTVKMKIFADLTTTETLDDFDDELNDNNKPAMNGNGVQEHHKQDEEQQHQQQQPQHKETDTETPSPITKSPSPATIKAEPAAAPIERAETKMASRSTPAAPAPPPPPPPPKPTAAPATKQGKVTRSSLNGIRSPTIVKRLRKSTRSTRFKATKTANNTLNGHTLGQSGNSQAGSAAAPAQGKAQSKSERGASGGGGAGAASNAKNRRTLFKRPAQKTPRVQACTRFVQSVFHKDSYVQIGDIVSIVDSEQNLYYAQIRGLLVDAYCEKSAFLTWLIPTQDSPDPKDGFDPATYLIGPDEELSRKLCFLEFVMHAPSNYYYDRTTPFPLPDVDEYTAHRSGGYIWTRLPALKRERERERDKKAAA